MTLLLGFAAVNTGNNLLFLVVSALLGFMAVTGVFGWLNIRQLRLDVAFPDEIYSSTETIVTLKLHNRRLLPSFLIRVDLFGTHADCPVVERGESLPIPLVATFNGRGEKQAGVCRVSSIFPVNFFVRFKTYHLDSRFVIFPRLLPTSIADVTGTGREGGAESFRSGMEGDLLKIGNYTGTEPRKLIHWRVSAKHDLLKVKGMSAMAAEPVILDLATVPGAGVEERLSRAAYLVNRLMWARRAGGLRLGERLIPPAMTRDHRLQLLRELALYDQD